jgi:MoaA/NifB/PqqE/SkfB family radical SAM enzyme
MIVAKFINYAMVNAQRMLRRGRVWGLPYYVVLDPSNVCQLQCVFCDGTKRPRVLMDFETFKRIVDQVGRTCINLELYNWGEPSLNKQLINMINYASERYGVYTRISSNLNLVNDDFYRDLVQSRLNALTISLDGASEASYRRYREGGSFESVLRNVKLLAGYKKMYHKAEPKLVWQFLVFRHNEDEIERAQAMARELGVNEIVFRKPHVPDDAREWDSSIGSFSNFTGGQHGTGVKCHWPYAGTAINANGSVSPCCGVAREGDDFGSVRDGCFTDVWNGGKFREARKYVSDAGTIESADNICGRCMMKGSINFDPSLLEAVYYQCAPLRALLLKMRGLKVRIG